MKKITYVIFAAVLMVASTLKSSAQSQETRQVSGFHAIASGGSFDIHVKINGTESLKISGSSEAIKEIETTVKDGKLRIKFKDRDDRDNDHFGKIDIYITAKALSELDNAGSGSINVDGTVSGDQVSISIAGSGSVSSSVKAGTFHASIGGSGSLKLNGSANDSKINIAGSGEMNGKGFKTSTANVSVAGSGNAYLSADKSIKASIVGSGNVVYSGNATADSRTVGSGRLSKAD